MNVEGGVSFWRVGVPGCLVISVLMNQFKKRFDLKDRKVALDQRRICI